MLNVLFCGGNIPQKFEYKKFANNKQAQAGSNLVSFNGRPPMTAEKLLASGERAVKKGQMFKGMDYFTRAVNKAEEEVAQGKMNKEKFVDMCVYVSKNFINGCVNAFNKSGEVVNKGLKMATGDPEGQKMLTDQASTLNRTFIGTQNAVKSIEDGAIVKYKNSEAGKLNQKAYDLQTKQIQNELKVMEEAEEKIAKKQPIGFQPKAVKSESKKDVDMPIDQAAALLQTKKINMEAKAMEEAESAIAKKQKLGFQPPAPTPKDSKKAS